MKKRYLPAQLGKITIINKHLHRGSNYIWCGRPSPVGNPFPMNSRTKEERDRVCDLYNTWFSTRMLGTNPTSIMVRDLVDRVLRGENINLGCVCKLPKQEVRCHCDTIKKFVELQALRERGATATSRQRKDLEFIENYQASYYKDLL